MNNEAIEIKQLVVGASAIGAYLPTRTGYQAYADLDGTEARKFLDSLGFEVISNSDEGNCGVAITKCGIALTTNGYCYRAG